MISTRVPRASPGRPFLKRALKCPSFPCNAMIFPRIFRCPTGQPTFRPISWAASPDDLTSGNLSIPSFGCCVLGPVRKLTIRPLTAFGFMSSLPFDFPLGIFITLGLFDLEALNNLLLVSPRQTFQRSIPRMCVWNQ